MPRRGLGPAQGEQRAPGGLRPRGERSGAEDARRRGNEFCWPAERGAARQRGGNRGADTTERRGQPGRSATGRSAAGIAERRADGVRAGGRPGPRVPDHARRPGVPGASERAPRRSPATRDGDGHAVRRGPGGRCGRKGERQRTTPGLTDPAAVSTAEATRTQPRADEPRKERARRPAVASASASAPRTAKVEARAAAQWAQRGPRRAASAVAASEARNEVKRSRDGDGAGSTERRVSPELPRGLAAAGGDRRYRTGATPARAEGGSSCRDGANGDGATGAAWSRFRVVRDNHNLQTLTLFFRPSFRAMPRSLPHRHQPSR